MVLKRQCSFCAGEVEPGTGTMFVKRDGTVFYFCTSSCRKQQLHLGRVGHRLKWTRAHSMKRAAEQSSAAGRGARAAKAGTPPPAPVKKAHAKKAEPETPPTKAPEAPAEKALAEPAPAETKKSADEPAAPKKPRARKPKAAAAEKS